MQRDVHDIAVPYVVRLSWASGAAQRVWEQRLSEARSFLQNEFAKLVVDHRLASFAPITPLEEEKFSRVTEAFVTNHYSTRWTTNEESKSIMGGKSTYVQVYGDPDYDIDLYQRWDIQRDLWQAALAPECCKKAYFDCPHRDPYHHLYEGAPGRIKHIPDAVMNPLLAPLGFYLSPIVPCSFTCEYAHQKSSEVAELIRATYPVMYETLKMAMELPTRMDSYRGLSIIDTPMFKAIFSTDAYKEKYILDVKVREPELFSYEHEWVAKGATFPYKGILTV